MTAGVGVMLSRGCAVCYMVAVTELMLKPDVHCCVLEHGSGELLHKVLFESVPLLSSDELLTLLIVCAPSGLERIQGDLRHPAAVSPELGSGVSVAERCCLERPVQPCCFAGGEFGTLAAELRVVVATWGLFCARQVCCVLHGSVASPRAVVRAQRTRQTCVG